MVSDPLWEQSHVGPGSRIGKYVLEHQIGHGGMAVVFSARDEQLGRRVALKIMAPSVASDPEFRERFARESRAAAAVDDPHIIPVFEAGESAGVLFIAMRYVAGGDVRSLLAREGPLSVDRAAAILVSVASALDAAHAAGLVHRDVKPGNMLMDVRRGRPDHIYLADFGLTKATAGAVTLTQTGNFLGTADYVAPEQIGGRPVDGRADQYALACSAVEMLTGETLFPHEEAMAVLTAHMSEAPPPLSTRRQGLPPELDAVLDRALAKSPNDRYRSCGDFSSAFQRAAGRGWYATTVLARASHGRREGEAAVLARAEPIGVSAEPIAAPPPLALPRPMKPAGRIDVGRGRRRGGRLVIAAATAVAVAAGVIVGFLAFAQPRHSPSAHATGTGHTHAAGTRKTPAAGTGHTTAPPALLPPGWETYHDPSGFAIGLPPGWKVFFTAPEEVKFTGTQGQFVLKVEWNTQPKADALADWQQQAAAKAATDPTYRQISLSQVSYRGYDTADWQFSNIVNGVRVQVIDRTFIVTPGQLSYAIDLQGPVAQWPAEYKSIWQQLVTSFEPAPAP